MHAFSLLVLVIMAGFCLICAAGGLMMILQAEGRGWYRLSGQLFGLSLVLLFSSPVLIAITHTSRWERFVLRLPTKLYQPQAAVIACSSLVLLMFFQRFVFLAYGAP